MIASFTVLVVVLSLGFTVLNGFRDASAAVALAVRTRALTASIAVVLAAFFNLLGVLLCLPLAFSLQARWGSFPDGMGGLTMIASALAGAILWNILMWWRGMPSSSTHAAFGGLFGAGVALSLKGGDSVPDFSSTLWVEVTLPLLLSPLIALAAAYVLVWPVTWASRNSPPSVVHRRFRMSQAISAAAVAFGHGLQDGQRAMMMILLALAAGASTGAPELLTTLLIFTAVAMAAGTLMGGWRISHTLGHRMIRVDPMRGFVAQGVAAALLFIGAIGLHLPISTTHTVTSGIWGAGLNQRFSGVNRRLFIRITAIWLLTPLAAAVLAFIFQLALSPLS